MTQGGGGEDIGVAQITSDLRDATGRLVGRASVSFPPRCTQDMRVSALRDLLLTERELGPEADALELDVAREASRIRFEVTVHKLDRVFGVAVLDAPAISASSDRVRFLEAMIEIEAAVSTFVDDPGLMAMPAFSSTIH